MIFTTILSAKQANNRRPHFRSISKTRRIIYTKPEILDQRISGSTQTERKLKSNNQYKTTF